MSRKVSDSFLKRYSKKHNVRWEPYKQRTDGLTVNAGLLCTERSKLIVGCTTMEVGGDRLILHPVKASESRCFVNKCTCTAALQSMAMLKNLADGRWAVHGYRCVCVSRRHLFEAALIGSRGFGTSCECGDVDVTPSVSECSSCHHGLPVRCTHCSIDCAKCGGDAHGDESTCEEGEETSDSE